MDSIATEGARVLFQGGPAWVIIVLLGLAIVFLFYEVKACTKARIEDTKLLVKATEDSTKALGAMAIALEANNRAMEARTRATEAMAGEIRELRQHIEAQEKIDEARRRGLP